MADAKKWKRLRLRSKLLIIIMISLVLISAMGLHLLVKMSEITEPLDTRIPQSLKAISEQSELDNLAQLTRYYDEVLTQSARNYAFTADPRWKERYYQNKPLADLAIRRAASKGDDQEKTLFSRIQRAHQAILVLEEQALDATDAGDTQGALEILESDEYRSLKDEYENELRAYATLRGAAYNEALYASTVNIVQITQRTNQDLRESMRILAAFLALLAAFAFIARWFFSRSIVNPLQELYNAVQQMQQRNFKAKVRIKTGDEFEEVGEALNKTMDTLNYIDQEHRELEQSKTKFLSITSHELRSPMTPMKAQLQLLHKGYLGKMTQKQKDALDIVIRNTDRLDQIIVDFLDVSRIEAARLKFRFQKTDLAPHLKRLVEEMKGFLPEKKIRVEVKTEKLPKVTTDPDRIMQVIRNLINNAKKFSPEKSTITVRAAKKENEILFSVSDQGVGIAPQNQQNVFEPFFQEEQTLYRTYSGTGLGLTICKGIIEGQGGKIWLKSQKGKGTTFYFTIPLEPVKEVKPIRLLFSGEEKAHREAASVFTEMLGPLGKKEFAELRNRGQATPEKLYKYVDGLVEQDVITKAHGKAFREKLAEKMSEKTSAEGKK